MNNQHNRKKSQVNPFAECCGLAGFLIAFATAFGVLTEDESYYAPCTVKSYSYEWGHITFLYLLVALGVTVVLVPILTIVHKKISKPDKAGFMDIILGGFLFAIRLGIFVLGIVCFAGLCYAYDQEEMCGKLQDLILAYIIITSIGLGLSCCLLLCSAFYLGAFLSIFRIKEKENKKEVYHSENQQLPVHQIEDNRDFNYEYNNSEKVPSEPTHQNIGNHININDN